VIQFDVEIQIVRITVESYCHRENCHLPLVSAVSVRYVRIKFLPIFCKSAVEVSNEIVSNFLNSVPTRIFNFIDQL
jgi:hypothetical protein